MTIILIQSESIFDSSTSCLVNPVNCVGVMGAGLAKQFKERYPDMFLAYKKYCRRLNVGTLHVYKGGYPWIINFPTKYHWYDKTKIHFIEWGLDAFLELDEKFPLHSVAFPKLGCGLGGLDWEKEVKPLMLDVLENAIADIFIYE